MIRRVCLVTLAILASPAALADDDQAASPFLTQALEFLGVSATPSNLRGEVEEGSGALWMVDLVTGVRLRFARGDYRSPIFLSDGQAVLALSGADLIQIRSPGAEPERIATIPGTVKLVGAHRDDPNRLLLLIEDDKGIRPAVFDLEQGRVVLSMHQEGRSNRGLIPHLLGSERVYADTHLYVREAHENIDGRPTTWTDVFIETADAAKARNLSLCKPASCLQPSLSADGRRAIYVKQTTGGGPSLGPR